MRYALQLAYKGTHYHGWQIQHNAHTVQAELEQALASLTKQTVVSIASGRTDAGVHAWNQYVHIDVENAIEDPEKWLYQLNCLLPEDILAKHVYAVSADFHARHDAISRTYLYRICRYKDPFTKPTEAHIYHRHIDQGALQACAHMVPMYQDFAAFCKYHHQSEHTLCTMHSAQWTMDDPYRWQFEIKANRFLRGMVRLLVGTMLEVGKGHITVQQFKDIIESRDVRMAKSAAPAEGLYLQEVEYKNDSLRLLA